MTPPRCSSRRGAVRCRGPVRRMRRMPGKPNAGRRRASGRTSVMDFATLYAENCAGCHGPDGRGGARDRAREPGLPGDRRRRAIRARRPNGVPGTSMPAFAQSAGGMLTDAQIDVLVEGIRRWAARPLSRAAPPPPYAAPRRATPRAGRLVYATYCESCHGPAATAGARAGSIVDGSFLALVSDQGLRTTVIAGRPDIGAARLAGDVAGRPMSDQEVTDVVAWLAAQRPSAPGQPYPLRSRRESTMRCTTR